MTLEGRVTYYADPLTIAVRGMTTQMRLLNVYTDNVAYADIPGYQKHEAVITTFAQYMGKRGINEVVNTEVGRLNMTELPTDFALADKGYFQKKMVDGRVELTRDGRFKIDKNGHIISQTGEAILSRQGTPLILPFMPTDITRDTFKVDTEGFISAQNPKTGQLEKVGQLGVVSEDGNFAEKVDVRQGFVEASNVFLHEEYVNIVPAKRNFSANRQVFLLHNQLLGRLIQEMGRAQ